jgi:hypothetical protein
MATKAERFRSDQQRSGRSGRKARTSRKKPAKASWSRDKHHAAVKATHALEETNAAGGRPSRKSTRASSNRAKPDAPFDITEEVRKGSPTARAARARAGRAKVRGATKG